MSRHLPSWLCVVLGLLLVMQAILPYRAVLPPPVVLADGAAAPLLAAAPASAPSAIAATAPFRTLPALPVRRPDQLWYVPGSAAQTATAQRPTALPVLAAEVAPAPTSAPRDPPLLPFLGLTATAEPAAVAPGEPVALTWRVENSDQEVVEGAILVVALPKELALTPAGVEPPLRYDPAARRLTWALPRLEPGLAQVGRATARLAGLRTGDALAVLAELRLADGTPVAQAAATVQAAPPAPAVTQLGPAGGVVTLAEEGVTLTFPPGALAEAVQVQARPVGRPAGAPGNIQRAYEFVVRGRGGAELHTFGQSLTLTVTHPEGAPAGGRLFLRDDATGAWQMLPTTWDAKASALVAAVPHLSTTGEGDNHVPEVMPSIRGIQPDLFTGSANIEYTIPLPPGAGGLAPQLALQYSSRSAYEDDGHSSVVGAGWKLSADSFIYGTPWETTSGPNTWRIGGAAFSEAGPEGTIYLKEMPQWRVKKAAGSDAYAPDGTRYHFEQALYDWNCRYSESEGWHLEARSSKWVLQYITDTVGNRIDYTYDTALPVNPVDVDDHFQNYGDRVRDIAGIVCDGPSVTIHYLSQINLTGISYNGGQTTISFTHAITRTDASLADPSDVGSWAFYTTRLLTAIKVKQAGSLVAAYKLDYDFFNGATSNNRWYALRAVRRCSDEGLTSCLPPMTFSNSLQQVGNNLYIRLDQVDNGYGGVVHLDYGGDNTVIGRTITDTVTGTANQWSYSYAGQLLDAYTVVGYAQVTETLPSSLGTGNTIYHHFLNGNEADVGFRGKEDQQIVTGGGMKQQESVRTWTGTTTGVYGGANFVYLGQEKQYVYDASGGNPQGRATQYFYDLDHQGSAQYGNLTRVKEFATATAPSPYRTTERWYYPNVDTTNGKYIVNRAAQEKLWEGEATSGICRGQTRSVYNNVNAGYTTPPTTGLLYKMRQTTSACDDTGVAPGWVVTQYNYDSRGNRTQVIAPNNTLTTTTTYDNIYYAYPLMVTAQPAPGQGPTLTTIYRYYGINPESGGFGLVGQFQTSTDPNSAVTRSTYDAFGRLIAVRRPGAGWSHAATEQYTYTMTAPFTVKHALKDDALSDAVAPGAATYLEDWTFYDGLGQVVQTQGEAGQSSNAIVVNNRYNALGLVVSQTLPYVVSVAPGAYQTPDWSQPQTQTRYDALGRTTVITNPAGITVSTFYNGRQTATLDELRHQTLATVDAFGRLSSSQQYSGTFTSPNWSTPAYATALYTYTVRDQLSGLAGADNATTSIIYDLAGRKTQMSDPDMGTWYYGYNDLGNLKYQIDAVKTNNLWRAVCFYYDGHNRLKGQTYPTGIASPTSYSCPADPGVYTITYGYDSVAGGNAGLGRRTAMTDASGSAAWVYDLRGRVTQESKVVSGSGTFVTRWAYDSADRVQSLTYPGGSGGQVGEVVTNTYNARGLLKTVIGASVYVTNTWYNPAGQVTDRMFGSAGDVRQNYTYSQANNFRLTTLKSGPSPSYNTQQNMTYAYDAAGNVRVITDTAALWGGQQVQSFSYDDLNRLKQAQADGGSGSYSQKVYLYNPAGNLTTFEDKGFKYLDSAHTHAVTHLNDVRQYWYDANGNVITRTNGGLTSSFSYNAENRLIGVSGAAAEAHTYDGDGNRIKAVVNGTTSVFIGAYYEVQGSITKTYYYADNVRVAERNGGVLHWLLSDHLGGTNVTLRADGTFSTTLRYLPYGDTRYNGGSQITSYRFTGQRWDSGTGLYFYNARWYDPYIGRFLAPDTIVPNPGNPQALNRYSYVGNRPLNLVDPSGHMQACADGDEGGGCGSGITTHWRNLYAQNQAQLDAEIAAWLQDHQNMPVITAMGSALEELYGETAAGIPQAYATMYATSFAGGELPQLWTNSQAPLVAGAIFAGVGIGGANWGGLKREMAGKPTGFGGGMLAADEKVVVFESTRGSGKIKTYDSEGQSAQSLAVAGSPEQAYQGAFGRSPSPGEPYWETTAGQIVATGRFAYLDAAGSSGHVSIYGGYYRNPIEFNKIWTKHLFGR